MFLRDSSLPRWRSSSPPRRSSSFSGAILPSSPVVGELALHPPQRDLARAAYGWDGGAPTRDLRLLVHVLADVADEAGGGGGGHGRRIRGGGGRGGHSRGIDRLDGVGAVPNSIDGAGAMADGANSGGRPWGEGIATFCSPTNGERVAVLLPVLEEETDREDKGNERK